jgi:hypothetical protein
MGGIAGHERPDWRCSIWDDATGRALLECSMQNQDKKPHPKEPASEDADHPVRPSTGSVPASGGKRPGASDAASQRPKVRMQRRPFSDN